MGFCAEAPRRIDAALRAVFRRRAPSRRRLRRLLFASRKAARSLARLRCESCSESKLVAFSCKGRGFCPSCLGRRMCATAANLVEQVLPP
ncbi:MAG TPA: transposase zinc-binding domain-containing protein, partial [Polyangiaceae bacterium]